MHRPALIAFIGNSYWSDLANFFIFLLAGTCLAGGVLFLVSGFGPLVERRRISIWKILLGIMLLFIVHAIAFYS